jgi:hypothetical protein
MELYSCVADRLGFGHTPLVQVLLSFAAALVALRLAGTLLRRRSFAWGFGLLSYAAACAALAWGAAHGWDGPSFRVYYLAGGLLTAPLLGVGSLLLAGRRWAATAGLLYAGLAIGVVLSMPVDGAFDAAIPAAQDHVGVLPRVVAIAGNSVGTLAVVVVALGTIRRRPLGNALLLAGIAVAGAGTAVAGTGVDATAGFAALAVVLLYLGVTPTALSDASAAVAKRLPSRSAALRS